MMTNLFSMFDPASIGGMSLNWISIFLGILFIPMSFWFLPNNYFLFYTKLINYLYSEFKMISAGVGAAMIVFISLFTLIVTSNFISLFPYIFTSTSHLVLNLTLSLPLWMSLMMFGWIEKTTHMFTHLVPQSTPLILVPFMVLIESISNIIRPITLMIRLSANLIAGHLLLTLLGNTANSSFLFLVPLILLIQIILLILEAAVAIIQSYVFSVLMTLYSSEI